MMGVNEVLATVGPAAIAAGAAALVGKQGVEQMATRLQSIDVVSEALGGAFHQTAGGYIGAGQSLQNYQNAYGGGMYEMGGAAINMLRSSSGPFLQQGGNTIAMIDRGLADMQANFQARGTAGQLAAVTSGGTDYLRQFGDIGANIGNTFLGLAPHLPGVGGDYISTLEGITGGLSSGIGFLNRNHMGDVLGALMAGEAGWRVGTPLVGLAGRGLGGLGSLAARMGLGLASSEGFAGTGLAGALGGAGDALAAVGGPEVAAAALSAFLGSKLYSSMPGYEQRQVGGLQAGVNNAGFSAAWQPLAHAIVTTTGLGISAAQTRASQEGIGATETYGELGRFGPMGQTSADIYKNAAAGFTQQMGDLTAAGPQLVAALHKAGLKSVSMGDAFQIAQNALLDMGHAFGPDGKLNKQAIQMVDNYVAGLAPMTRSGGAFGAAVSAQTIMSSSAMKSLSQVNQSMDSMTQIMTGGPAGMATLFGMLGGTPTTTTHGGLRLSAPPAMQSMAQALTSFSSVGGASAWNTFAGSQGLVAAEQQNLDQLRTALTLGAIGQKGAAGLAGFQLQQMLPLAKKSPAALAMLMQQGSQMGIGGYYDPSKSQGQNYENEVKAFSKIADSAKQADQATNSMVVKLSNLPAVAKQFTQGTGADIQSQQIAKAAQDAVAIKSGINVKVNANDLVSQLKAAGVQGAAALKASLDAVLAQAGIGKAQRIKIEAQVQGISQVQDLKNEIAQLHDKEVTAKAHGDSSEVRALNAQIAELHDKLVTITTDIVTVRMTSANNPYAGGISGRMSTGGMVPGVGSGDHVPALLEPGEAIVPRYLVPLVAPILRSHHVPGFAAGGIVPAGSLAGVNAQLSSEWKILDQMYASNAAKAQIDAFWKDILDPLYKAKDAFKGMAQHAATAANATTKAASATAKAATALEGKFATAMNYARSVSANVMSGANITGLDLTQGTVAQGLQGYLASITAFRTDLAALTKGHLNKDLLKQLIAAGPVTGDQYAQSILQGGGIGMVNKLWSQIGVAAHGLGAQAAGSIYGQTIAPNLRSGTVTSNNIVINVSAPGGAAGNLPLTPAQIKTITEEIQAKLLQQAKRNRQTGLKLKGYGA